MTRLDWSCLASSSCLCDAASMLQSATCECTSAGRKPKRGEDEAARGARSDDLAPSARSRSHAQDELQPGRERDAVRGASIDLERLQVELESTEVHVAGSLQLERESRG